MVYAGCMISNYSRNCFSTPGHQTSENADINPRRWQRWSTFTSV